MLGVAGHHHFVPRLEPRLPLPLPPEVDARRRDIAERLARSNAVDPKCHRAQSSQTWPSLRRSFH